MAMLRRAPKHSPTQTWVKSYLYIARTVTCPSMEETTNFQVKALTCWSLTTPTHYGEIKLFTTGFITVPEIPSYCSRMYNFHKNITPKNTKLFLIPWKLWYKRLSRGISIFYHYQLVLPQFTFTVGHLWVRHSLQCLINIWRSLAYVPCSHVCTVRSGQVPVIKHILSSAVTFLS